MCQTPEHEYMGPYELQALRALRRAIVAMDGSGLTQRLQAYLNDRMTLGDFRAAVQTLTERARPAN